MTCIVKNAKSLSHLDAVFPCIISSSEDEGTTRNLLNKLRAEAPAILRQITVEDFVCWRFEPSNVSRPAKTVARSDNHRTHV